MEDTWLKFHRNYKRIQHQSFLMYVPQKILPIVPTHKITKSTYHKKIVPIVPAQNITKSTQLYKQ